MRFHLIDRIDELVESESVRARKLTSWAETYWEPGDDHVAYEGAAGVDRAGLDGDRAVLPVMPPPLVLEALCQAGTWLIMASTDRRKRAALLQVGSVRFLGPVHPGDVLDLRGRVESMSDEIAVLSGTADVDGRSVLEAEDIMCAMLDADELEDPESSARMLRSLLPVEAEA